MLKIKKILLASGTNFFLKKKSFLFVNILFSKVLSTVNAKKARLFYSSVKFLNLFEFLNSAEFKFPLCVFIPCLSLLKVFFSSEALFNVSIRYLNFLFTDVHLFIFLKRSSSFMFFYFAYLLTNIYKFLKLKYD